MGRVDRNQALVQGFSVRLVQACKDIGWKERGLPARLSESLGGTVSIPAARKWVSGDGLPDIDNMIELSDILGVSLDWLLKGGVVLDDNSHAKELSQSAGRVMALSHEYWLDEQVRSDLRTVASFCFIKTQVGDAQ